MLTRSHPGPGRTKWAGTVMFVIVSMIIATGCGTEPSPAAVGERKVLWEGSIDDRPEDKASFDKTVACLAERFGLQEPKPHPRLVLMSDQFMVQGQGPYDGYIFFDSNIMYVRNSNRESWIVSHETIHWMYQIGDSLHGSEPYKVCQQ